MKDTYSSYADLYRRGPHAPHVEAVREPAGAALSMIRCSQPSGHYPDAALPEFSLQINSGRAPVRASWDQGTGRHHGPFMSGSWTLAPANTACDYMIEDPSSLLILNISASSAASMLNPVVREFDNFGRLHGVQTHDAFVTALAERMWIEAAQDTRLSRLFLDASVLMLVTALYARAEGWPLAKLDQQTQHCGGLPPWRLKRVVELIDDRLPDNLSLKDLAEVAELSEFHFCRAFRRSTGMTPHSFLTLRRIERAKELLLSTKMTAADIAEEVGFGSPQGFFSAFRRVTGATPQVFRNDRLN